METAFIQNVYLLQLLLLFFSFLLSGGIGTDMILNTQQDQL
jgi:hypothetical protein